MREEEGLPRARKEEPPTSSTRPKPPTPRVSMMLKSDSFRLAKKAASASYLDFLMRKNGNFLEVQTREPRTTDPEWQDCGSGFTCSNSILLLESMSPPKHNCLVPVVQNNQDLHLFSKENKTKRLVPASHVTDASSHQISYIAALSCASSCERGLVGWFFFGFVLGFLVLLGFGFAVQIWDGSFSWVSLIHRLAVGPISIY